MPADLRPDLGEAVALAYEQGAMAPRVVAKGRGLVAAEIIRRAGEAGVYVHESPDLVRMLMQVDLDATSRRSSTSRWRSCWPGSTASRLCPPSEAMNALTERRPPRPTNSSPSASTRASRW